MADSPDRDGASEGGRLSATFVPHPSYERLPESAMIERARAFRDELRRRRTIRAFSDEPVPRAVLEAALEAAGSAPSGANLQPWHFVVVTDPAVKSAIRHAAEREEHEFYHHRAPPEWLEALAPLGTDEHKPYLETAPCLVVVFARRFGTTPSGRRVAHYYVSESVGIATGFLIAALHGAGLAMLTHTPSPMGFLNEILDRPATDKPFLVLVVGYPAADASVPDIRKKPLVDIATFR